MGKNMGGGPPPPRDHRDGRGGGGRDMDRGKKNSRGGQQMQNQDGEDGWNQVPSRPMKAPQFERPDAARLRAMAAGASASMGGNSIDTMTFGPPGSKGGYGGGFGSWGKGSSGSRGP